MKPSFLDTLHLQTPITDIALSFRFVCAGTRSCTRSVRKCSSIVVAVPTYISCSINCRLLCLCNRGLNAIEAWLSWPWRPGRSRCTVQQAGKTVARMLLLLKRMRSVVDKTGNTSTDHHRFLYAWRKCAKIVEGILRNYGSHSNAIASKNIIPCQK